VEGSVKVACPICLGTSLRTVPYTVLNLVLVCCARCGLIFQERPSVKSTIYSHQYYSHWELDSTGYPAGNSKIKTSSQLLHALLDSSGRRPEAGQLLDIGCAHGQMLEAARRMGLNPIGVEISPAGEHARSHGFTVFGSTLDQAPFSSGQFDFVTMVDVIEHVEDPLTLLREARALLRPNGAVLLMTPDVGSLACRLLGNRWPHFKDEHLVYFSKRSIGFALTQAGFSPTSIRTGTKYLSLDYALADLSKYGRMPRVSRALMLSSRVLPAGARRVPVPLPSDLLAIAQVAQA
jgi:2-polyprenyl-3-methyl-5-hydroxy-6-metoxy-1,4-benzoquinol methylase